MRQLHIKGKDVSIIVFNWNGLRFLEACLQSLMQQTWSDCEVIVVDNGSTDRSVQYAGSNFLSVPVIHIHVALQGLSNTISILSILGLSPLLR